MNFIPRKALIQVAKGLDIPLARIYGIAIFYKAFSLERRGRHTGQVCLGTACHVRGGARTLDYLETRLATKAGQTSILEGNPQSVIERMIIGAYAMGSQEGYVYVHNENPIAVKNLTF